MTEGRREGKRILEDYIPLRVFVQSYGRKTEVVFGRDFLLMGYSVPRLVFSKILEADKQNREYFLRSKRREKKP
jgi:hypothetical protein